MKFVQYKYIRQNTLKSWNKNAYIINCKFPIYIYDKIHSKLEQKKPTKYIVYFQSILKVSDIYAYTYIHQNTPCWNKNAYKA